MTDQTAKNTSPEPEKAPPANSETAPPEPADTGKARATPAKQTQTDDEHVVPGATVNLSGTAGSAAEVIDATVAALEKAGATPEQVSRFRSKAKGDSYDELFETVQRWAKVK